MTKPNTFLNRNFYLPQTNKLFPAANSIQVPFVSTYLCATHCWRTTFYEIVKTPQRVAYSLAGTQVKLPEQRCMVSYGHAAVFAKMSYARLYSTHRNAQRQAVTPSGFSSVQSLLRSLLWIVPAFFNDCLLDSSKTTITLRVLRSFELFKILFFLRESSRFRYKQVSDLVGDDTTLVSSTVQNRNTYKLSGFRVIYKLLSFLNCSRLDICTYSKKFSNSTISTVCLYPALNWSEREVWDMYGVYFIGNKDHRRILTDYGFSGFPLRKTFPLTGFIELYYSERLRRVRYIPVSFKQEFREFFFNKDLF